MKVHKWLNNSILQAAVHDLSAVSPDLSWIWIAY